MRHSQFGGVDIKSALIGGGLVLIAVLSYLYFSKDNSPPPEAAPVEKTAMTELSLNGIDVGIDVDKFKKIMSEPNSTESFDDYEIYRYVKLKAEVRNNIVTALMTEAENVNTKSGIHVGSSYSDIVNAYGQNSTNSTDKYTTYEYSINGLNNADGVLKFSMNGEHISDTVIQISARILPQIKSTEDVEQAKLALNNFINAISRKDYEKAYEDMLSENYKSILPKPKFLNLCQRIISLEFKEVFKVISVKPNAVVLEFEANERTGVKIKDNPEANALYTLRKGEVEMVKEYGVWKINLVKDKIEDTMLEK
ncbi:MAG: hypothetical protein IJT73_01650 [Selenomonadaceae bacterium]|nr:hypothetical protein [Selenomonadaceae bacterium]